jgi:hypothetical protein
MPRTHKHRKTTTIHITKRIKKNKQYKMNGNKHETKHIHKTITITHKKQQIRTQTRIQQNKTQTHNTPGAWGVTYIYIFIAIYCGTSSRTPSIALTTIPCHGCCTKSRWPRFRAADAARNQGRVLSNQNPFYIPIIVCKRTESTSRTNS